MMLQLTSNPDALFDEIEQRCDFIKSLNGEEAIHLMRKLDVHIEQMIAGFDMDPANDIDVFEMADYAALQHHICNRLGYELERVRETDSEQEISGLKFTSPDGTVVVDPTLE